MLKETALNNDDSFSTVYRSYMDEVRAVRNRDKWMRVDRDRDQKKIMSELKLNMPEENGFGKFPK